MKQNCDLTTIPQEELDDIWSEICGNLWKKIIHSTRTCQYNFTFYCNKITCNQIKVCIDFVMEGDRWRPNTIVVYLNNVPACL